MLHSEHVKSERKFVTCDFCEKRLERHKRCPGCKKDVCPNCGVWWFLDPFSGDNNGDYPPLVCEECDCKAKKYAPHAIEIQQEADEKVAAIHAEWLRACSAT